MTQTTRFHPDRELKAAVRIAGLVVAGFAACFTVWSIAVPLAGAVVAPASVAVSGKAKAVQHKEGGVIAQIFVREGDRVTAGSMLMRLDDTQAKADFALLASQRWASTAREARLLAERSGAEDLILAAGQEDLRTDAAFQHVLQSERMMFVTRRTSRDGQKRQLTERAAQIEEQIQGSTRLLEARRKELVVLRAEHAELIPLRKVGLVNNMRFNTLERTLASVQGDEGNLTATIAASLAQMVEIRTQIANIDREHAAEVARDLRETEDRLVETREKLIAARDRLEKTVIRAPASGIVHQLTAVTVGGVAGAGEILAQIVPEEDRLVLEARVERNDIDRIWETQAVRVRFPAFDRRITPELPGAVEQVGADAVTDPKSNGTYYKVIVAVAADDLRKLGFPALRPGMQAEAYIQTGDRTAFDYFTKPLKDQLSRAFTER